MTEKIENYDFKLIKIEEGKKEKYKFTFRSDKLGYWNIDIEEKYYDSFKALNNYTLSMIVDDLNEKKEGETYWVNLSLEKILEKDKIIWEK